MIQNSGGGTGVLSLPSLPSTTCCCGCGCGCGCGCAEVVVCLLSSAAAPPAAAAGAAPEAGEEAAEAEDGCSLSLSSCVTIGSACACNRDRHCTLPASKSAPFVPGSTTQPFTTTAPAPAPYGCAAAGLVLGRTNEKLPAMRMSGCLATKMWQMSCAIEATPPPLPLPPLPPALPPPPPLAPAPPPPLPLSLLAAALWSLVTNSATSRSLSAAKAVRSSLWPLTATYEPISSKTVRRHDTGLCAKNCSNKDIDSWNEPTLQPNHHTTPHHTTATNTTKT
jgi:hypothetical protein